MSQNAEDGLRRTLSLWQVVLYGLGVTIGAGIYVLVGVAAGRSGVFAPLAFLVAAALLSFTALSFAELGTRLPVAASEAAYVNTALARIRHREQVRPPHIFHAPAFAPYAGMAATLILLVASAW